MQKAELCRSLFLLEAYILPSFFSYFIQSRIFHPQSQLVPVFSQAPVIALDYRWSHNPTAYRKTVTPTGIEPISFRDPTSKLAGLQVHATKPGEISQYIKIEAVFFGNSRERICKKPLNKPRWIVYGECKKSRKYSAETLIYCYI